MHFDGLITYVAILIRPRDACERLRQTPTWGWAAIAGIAMTLGAVLLAERAQLHVLAVSEAHRMAALPPGERLQEQIAVAQVARYVRFLFIVGALTTPWITWFLIAVFFFAAAVISRSRPRFGAAWVAALNSFSVYSLGGVVNATLLALRNSHTVNAGSDLVLLPSPGWLFPHHSQPAVFLSAYNIFNVWYYVVVAFALERLLRMPRAAAIAAAVGYSLLYGFFAVAAVGGGR